MNGLKNPTLNGQARNVQTGVQLGQVAKKNSQLLKEAYYDGHVSLNPNRFVNRIQSQAAINYGLDE